MKTIKSIITLVVLLAAVASQGASVSISGGSLADMIFRNGTFDFTTKSSGAGAGYQWLGGSPTDDNAEYLASFSGGPWSIGAISTSGNKQWATANGTSTLTIWDEATGTATANLSWQTITTQGAGGSINTDAKLNITSFSYVGGTDPTLVALRDAIAANHGLGTILLSFQFPSTYSLSTLFAPTANYRTSYSVVLSSVPEPTTVIAGALLVIPFGMSTLRVLRVKRQARS